MALGKQVDQYESKYKIITKELEQEKLKVSIIRRIMDKQLNYYFSGYTS